MASQYSNEETTYATDRPRRESRTNGGDSGGVLKHIVEEAVNVVSERKDELIHETARRAKSRISENKNRAAEDLGKMASVLREACQKLREQDQESVAHYTERAAETVEKVSDFIREKEPAELANEVQEYVRQRPAILVGGALVAGFLLARFLRSSEQGREADENSAREQRYQDFDKHRSDGETYQTH